MTGLGLIATGAAYLNYQQAKKNYDQVKENTEAVYAIMNSYQSAYERYNYLLEHPEEYAEVYTMEREAESRERDNARLERPDGLKFGVLIRVGCLVGKMMRTETVLTVTNSSDKAYYIYQVNVDDYLLGAPLNVINWRTKKEYYRYINVNEWIQPGQTMVFPFPKGIAMLMDVKKDPETGEVVVTEAGDVEVENIIGKLRDIICESQGKQLITSCTPCLFDPNGELLGSDAAKASVYIYWTDDPEGIEQEAVKNGNIGPWGQSVEQYAVDNISKIARWQGYPALWEYKGELWT